MLLLRLKYFDCFTKNILVGKNLRIINNSDVVVMMVKNCFVKRIQLLRDYRLQLQILRETKVTGCRLVDGFTLLLFREKK